MKEKKERLSRFFALVLLLALAGAPPFGLLRRANAQGRIDLRALGIDNEAQQISSLVEAHAKFFKRAAELKQRGNLLPGEVIEFKKEADRRKGDLPSIKRELESQIRKLKQGNHWNEAFDAQVLSSLSDTSVRSVVTQAGGARRLFELSINEINLLQGEIDDEVRQVTSKQVSALRNRGDLVFVAYTKPAVNKIGCNILLVAFIEASLVQARSLACSIAQRYNDKGCSPRVSCN